MNQGQLNSPGLDHAENVLSTLIASDSARDGLYLGGRCVVDIYSYKPLKWMAKKVEKKM